MDLFSPSTTDEEPGDFEKGFRRIKLENDATRYYISKNYEEARKVLRDLKSLIVDEHVATKVYYLAMESECRLRLDKNWKENDKILRLLKEFDVKPDDVVKTAKSLKKEWLHIRAYVLYNAAFDLYKLKTTDDAAARNIKEAFSDMKDMAEEMQKDSSEKNILQINMVPAMRKFAEELEGSEIQIPGLGGREKAEVQAWCYYYTAWCYYYLKQHQSELEMYEAAIAVMNELGDEIAETYQVTGMCCNNAGVVYDLLGHKEKAREYFKTALRMIDNAKDYKDIIYAKNVDLGSIERNEVLLSPKLAVKFLRRLLPAQCKRL